MEVFRISKEIHAQTLRVSGSANRWNVQGQYVIYAGSSRSLASLELAVHRGSVQPLNSYKTMVISIADEDYLFRQISRNELPDNWRTVAGYSALQRIGSAWYTTQETLVLKVPSAVIPYEYNYMINTEHPDFSKCVQLVRTEAYFWDTRLL
ncbi:RES family NAD+ phosphorylase [uncultured Spirosoma sp.]|uniref:RES family NAD+ phosphorylase n=1 Tax=uncultured Spirosoma sp. TaxID=278208 RepID=UPI0025910B48|nr:RES family NAD+ phosphorylase [uncultured Spirosoma sp.]